jgi:hypothetical protein
MNEKERFIYECEFSNLAQQAFEWFRRREIEPILIKGWLASQNYPINHFRHFGDIDLIIPSETPRKIAKEVESKFAEEVDLHFGLRNHDTFSYKELFRNSQTKKLLNGFEIRCASPEDHLRIMAVHWLNDGGIAKTKLWDIYYAVVNRYDDFNWQKCLNVVSPIRRKWILTVISLCHFYLDLPINDLPFAEEIKEPDFVPKWVFETLDREWNTHIPLIPLTNSFGSLTLLIRQIRKRINPNPIQSAIYSNSAIDDSSRIPSHIKATYLRALNIPSVTITLYRKRRVAKKTRQAK